MKKFLCAILAIGMLCGVAAFAGCKKNDGGNNSSRPGGGHNNNSFVEVPGEWEDNWDL